MDLLIAQRFNTRTLRKAEKANASVFTAAAFFALRTPLLPTQTLKTFGEGLCAGTATPDALGAALAQDRQRLRIFLREIFSDPIVQEALFIASPSLAEHLLFWFLAPESEKGAKVEKPLLRYFQRMSGRSTPFGLFAGCSTGTIAERTALVLSPRQAYQRHTRLDMQYLCTLTDALSADPHYRRSLRYTANNSLYKAAGSLRYIEGRVQADRTRSYHLVSVEATDYLLNILEHAQTVGGTFDDFCALLVSPEITTAEAEDFVHTLIDHQLLLPLLAPPVTATQPIQAVIDQLSQHEASRAVAKTLMQSQDRMVALDQRGLGAAPHCYQEIAALLQSLPTVVELPRLFQVDMTKPAPEATLGHAIIADITEGLELLHTLAQPEDLLESFKKRFIARYEAQEVPLVEALDDDCGIGLLENETDEASPLLSNLDFPVQASAPKGDVRDPYLLRLLQNAVQEGAQEIVLSKDDIEALSVKGPKHLPTSLSVTASIEARSAAAVAQGQYTIFMEASPGSANLLGRFCHADPELRTQLEAHLRAEEALSPDEIFAEIVHLPPGRVGNVICRPQLRPHEIPYLGFSSAEKEAQIPVQDLMVSVQGGRVRLRSKRLGRYIVPRMANAHHFTRADVGLYCFLCLLRSDGHNLGWHWGSLATAPFLPRVSHGKWVLSLARWNIYASDIKALCRATGDHIFIEAQKLRKQHRLPRHVLFAQSDNMLPVDFENILSIEAFVGLLKDGDDITLREVFPSYDALLCESNEGRFSHEIVIPFLVTPPSRQPEPVVQVRPPSLRSFAPGSQWLYAKLYTGTATADEVLMRVVQPVVERAKAAGATRWFFIRYGDPDWHLRLRIEGDPSWLWPELAPMLYAQLAPLMTEGQVWRMQLDTYTQEVERYGGSVGMALSERIFEADSEAALGIVGQLSGEEGNEARWRLALIGMDRLLTDLGLGLSEKLRLLATLRQGFAEEFHATAPLERQLDAKYRAERPGLQAREGCAFFDTRSERMAEISKELFGAAQQGQLSTTIHALAGSYLHMHANRLLRAAARAQELVLYDFLHRIYTSQAARQRKNT